MAARKQAARPWRIVAVVLTAVAIAACTGPVPLSRAIWPQHDQEFRGLLATHPESPQQSWFVWKAKQNDISVEQSRQRDEALSTTHNPFDANRDVEAVSRGAVIYRAYCQRCHGPEARGDGLDLVPGYAPRDMHAFAQRFAVTLHKGAPRAWFGKINEGFGDEVTYPDGTSRAMPPFGDTLAREQIWLVITYLQSLDLYHQTAPDESSTKS